MHHRMISDYFCDEPVYESNLFRRRYCMQRSFFLTIMEKISQWDNYFVQKIDAYGYVGLSSQQKCTSALRMLCYGLSRDATGGYCRTSESTAMECMIRFYLAIRAEFEVHLLRQPTGKTLKSNWLLIVIADSPTCLRLSIACIMFERIISFLDKGFWRQIWQYVYHFRGRFG